MLFINRSPSMVSELVLEDVFELLFNLGRTDFLIEIRWIFDEDGCQDKLELKVWTDYWDPNFGETEENGLIKIRLVRSFTLLESFKDFINNSADNSWRELALEDRKTLKSEIKAELDYWMTQIR